MNPQLKATPQEHKEICALLERARKQVKGSIDPVHDDISDLLVLAGYEDREVLSSCKSVRDFIDSCDEFLTRRERT